MTETNPARRRYAVVGTGHRSQMYIDAILGDHAEVAELVAWCEPNAGRAAYYDAQVAETTDASSLPRYTPEALEEMIATEAVDVAIVTSPDHTHADVVSRTLHAGADVVVEKPLTIDVDGCRTIETAVRETGRHVVMTFNYRYSPRNAALKEVIASGQIGDVVSVHFEWALDTMHGADYFRRWHRYKDRSGGLLVHKSSHHFDLVNWWLADTPGRVYARGALNFYGGSGAGVSQAPPRPARGSEAGGADPWSLDLRKDERLRRLYLDAEHHDGYLRDRDIFDDDITIEDNIAVLVDYSGGAVLTYSLNAHAPWEGYRVTVNGTKGRAELEVVERGSIEVDDDGQIVLDPSALEARDTDQLRPKGERLLVQRHWQRAAEHPIPMGEGSHGGGDAILLRDVFRGPDQDPLGRPAGYVDGIHAVAVGIAGNESIRTGMPVVIADLGLRDDR